MAFFARLIGVEFFIQVPVVHIRMAVRTFFTDISELPFFIGILLVTGKTRRCHMPAFQLEFRFVVIVNCEQTSGESIDSVAFGTIGAKPEDGGQLPFMVIFMTGVAGIMRKWIGKIICGMAFFAINRFMFPLQHEPGQVMVEIFHGYGCAE